MSTDPLVSTQWLADHLKDSNVRVLDASFKLPGVTPLPKDDFLSAHIPGSVFFDVDAVSDHTSDLPHMFPSAEQFGRDVGSLGVGNDDTVVVYDAGGWVAAPRAWWRSNDTLPAEMLRRTSREYSCTSPDLWTE